MVDLLGELLNKHIKYNIFSDNTILHIKYNIFSDYKFAARRVVDVLGQLRVQQAHGAAEGPAGGTRFYNYIYIYIYIYSTPNRT